MSKAVISTSLEGVRRLAVSKQRLVGKFPVRPTDESILSIVRDLCYVQWDPVDAVAPSHVIAFWSRLGNYRLSDLERLLWDEKKLFLHWTPIASIVLTEDYPIYSSLMKRYPESLSKSWGGGIVMARKFLAEHKELRKRMLSELDKKGPLEVTQFQDYVRTQRSDGWTSGGDVSRMLHYLLMRGEVMVVGHRGLQNVWGLTEKFLSARVRGKELSEEEFEHEATQRSLRALGIATPREIHLYFPRGRYRGLKQTLDSLEKEGRISRVHVEGLGGRDNRYIHESDVPLLESVGSDAWEPRTVLLAPFDNFFTDRGRTQRLFGFDYMHENFLPEKKRKYGTFVHPILRGDKLIGRVDLLRDKENQKLNVLSVHAEPGAPGKDASSEIGETIRKLGEFLGVKEVTYPVRVPVAWRNSLH